MPSGKYNTDHCRISIPTPLYRRLCATAAGRRISVTELLDSLLFDQQAKQTSGPIENVWPPRGENFADHD